MSDPPPPPPPSGGPPPPPPPGFPVAGTAPNRTLATLAHAGQLLGGFIVPLIIYLMQKDTDPFVADQAKEALNFSITMTIAAFASLILMFVLIGFLTIFAVAILGFILPIMGAVAANRGEYYRYPLCLRLVS